MMFFDNLWNDRAYKYISRTQLITLRIFLFLWPIWIIITFQSGLFFIFLTLGFVFLVNKPCLTEG